MRALGTVLFIIVIGLASAAPVFAQDASQVYVQSISYGGSGCPQGSMATSFSNDRLSFTLIFDRFVASTGPGVDPTENRKNCQLNVNLHLPQGSGNFCTAFDYRGYVAAPAGSSGEAKRIYYYDSAYVLPDGQPIGEDLETRTPDGQLFAGPVNKDYLGRDNEFWSYNIGPDAGFVRPVNVNAQVRIIGPGAASAQMTNDSIDGKIINGPCPSSADTTPPAITISNPVPFGLYGLGASVAPVFSCTDGESGVASCTGAPLIDTSSIGPKTFTVTAVDNAGNTSTASVTYAVGGKNECKGGGHSKFLVPAFKNQGLCVSTYAGQ